MPRRPRPRTRLPTQSAEPSRGGSPSRAITALTCTDVVFGRDSRQAFQQAENPQVDDLSGFSTALSGLAKTESKRGHFDEAVRLESEALRYASEAGNVASIANDYRSLGVFLYEKAYYQRETRWIVPTVACYLTTALIYELAGIQADEADVVIGYVSTFLNAFSTRVTLPTDIADLCGMLGDIPWIDPRTDPAGLIARLSPNPETAEQALQEIIVRTQAWGREAE